MYDYLVLGGDMRQTYLADILMKQGYHVTGYLLPEIPSVQKETDSSGSQPITDFLSAYNEKEKALLMIKEAKAVLAPIPITKNNKSLNHKVEHIELTLDELYENLRKGQILIGGCLPKWFVEKCNDKACICYDYLLDESIAVRNAVATAEGVIAEAVFKHPGNIHGSNCLILGFGRCGKVLAEKLKGLSANVTVCVRKDSDAAWAKSLGYEAVFFDCDEVNPEDCVMNKLGADAKEQFEILRECIGKFPLIFNTVPFQVLNRELLSRVDKSGVIFDIASAPGGVDYEAAMRIGVKAELCPSLPGIYAPKASAEILSEAIKRISKSNANSYTTLQK